MSEGSEASSIKVNCFTAMKDFEPIHFQIIQLQGSLMIWIGNKTKQFSSLAMSNMTKYEKNPLSINMLGDCSNFSSQNLAKKLAKKTGKQVYVSYSLPENEETEKFIDSYLFGKMQTDPQMFS